MASNSLPLSPSLSVSLIVNYQGQQFDLSDNLFELYFLYDVELPIPVFRIALRMPAKRLLQAGIGSFAESYTITISYRSAIFDQSDALTDSALRVYNIQLYPKTYLNLDLGSILQPNTNPLTSESDTSQFVTVVVELIAREAVYFWQAYSYSYDRPDLRANRQKTYLDHLNIILRDIFGCTVSQLIAKDLWLKWLDDNKLAQPRESIFLPASYSVYHHLVSLIRQGYNDIEPFILYSDYRGLVYRYLPFVSGFASYKSLQSKHINSDPIYTKLINSGVDIFPNQQSNFNATDIPYIDTVSIWLDTSNWYQYGDSIDLIETTDYSRTRESFRLRYGSQTTYADRYEAGRLITNSSNQLISAISSNERFRYLFNLSPVSGLTDSFNAEVIDKLANSIVVRLEIANKFKQYKYPHGLAVFKPFEIPIALNFQTVYSADNQLLKNLIKVFSSQFWSSIRYEYHLKRDSHINWQERQIVWLKMCCRR